LYYGKLITNFDNSFRSVQTTDMFYIPRTPSASIIKNVKY